MGRFPSRSATSWIVETNAAFASLAVSGGPAAASSAAASTVPAQVRKSVAVKSSPMASRR